MKAPFACTLGMAGLLLAPGYASAQAVPDSEEPPPVEQPQATEAAPAPKKKTYAQDISTTYTFAGGGIVDNATQFGDSLAGRALFGWGGYWFILHGSFAAEGDFSKQVPWNIRAVGHFGLTVPIPIVHLQLGLRLGGGAIRWQQRTVGEFIVGAQFSTIISEYGGGYGVRLGATLDFGWFASEVAYPRLGLTLSFCW